MALENYNREDLDKDLAFLVKQGLLDIFMREDGVWVYSPAEKSKEMSDEKIVGVIMEGMLDGNYDE